MYTRNSENIRYCTRNGHIITNNEIRPLTTAKIIGHRGAAGLVHENTLAGFLKAIELGVDAIELDVQITSDGQFVLYHEPIARLWLNAIGLRKQYPYAQLQASPLSDGQYIPLLRDVLEATRGTPTILDIKIKGHMRELCDMLADFPETNFTFVSDIRSSLVACKRYRPDCLALSQRRFLPFSVFKSVFVNKFDGININRRLLNPLTYRIARRFNLQIMTYTVNDLETAKRIRQRYPGIWICTNYPNLFVPAFKRSVPAEG